MPYFPKQSETAYRCAGCGGSFVRGNVSCCVAHAPGTCCHYGEKPVAAANPAPLPNVWTSTTIGGAVNFTPTPIFGDTYRIDGLFCANKRIVGGG